MYAGSVGLCAVKVSLGDFGIDVGQNRQAGSKGLGIPRKIRGKLLGARLGSLFPCGPSPP